MSVHDIVFIFVVSCLFGVIALLCWLLQLIFNKLHLDVISEIFDSLKCVSIIALIIFGGFFIFFLSISGIGFVAKYITNFIIALF